MLKSVDITTSTPVPGGKLTSIPNTNIRIFEPVFLKTMGFTDEAYIPLPEPFLIPYSEVESKCQELLSIQPNTDRPMNILFMGDSTMKQLAPWIYTSMDALVEVSKRDLPFIGEYIPYYASGLKLSAILSGPWVDIQRCNVAVIKLQIDFSNTYQVSTNNFQEIQQKALFGHVMLLQRLLTELQNRRPGMAIILVGPNLMRPKIIPKTQEAAPSGVNLVGVFDKILKEQVIDAFCDAYYISTIQATQSWRPIITEREYNGPHTGHLINYILSLEIRKLVVEIYLDRARMGISNIESFDATSGIPWDNLNQDQQIYVMRILNIPHPRSKSTMLPRIPQNLN